MSRIKYASIIMVILLFSSISFLTQAQTDVVLLAQSVVFSPSQGDVQHSEGVVDPLVLQNKDTLEVQVNLNGYSIYGGDASAIAFTGQGEWKYVSLLDYVNNGVDGVQQVSLPLSNFRDNNGQFLDINSSVNSLHFRFWSDSPITVEIISVVAHATSDPTTIPTQTSVPTSTDTPVFTPTIVNTSTQLPNTVTYTPTVTAVSEFNDGFITNGSFEVLNGAWVDGWSNIDGAVIDTSVQGNHGNNSLLLSPSSTYKSISSWGFAIDSSKSYVWSQYVRTSEGTGTFGFVIDEYDANWNYLTSHTMYELSGSTQGIITLDYTPSSGDVANVSVQYFANETTFNVWVDSVSVSETTTVAVSTPTSITQAPIIVPPGTNLPSNWDNTDIGAVGIAGAGIYSQDTFILRGSGTDIWRNNVTFDEFHFVYQTLVGDGEITARITDLTAVDEWTKAGVMFKETLIAGSDYVLLGDTRDHEVAMQWGYDQTTNDVFEINPPYWLQLVRQANTFTGYVSIDGNNWTQINQVNVEMEQAIYVGMFITAHNNSEIASSSFDNVTVQPNPSFGPTATAISVPTNTSTPVSQPIVVTPTQTPLPIIRACPSGVGPNGIPPGDYPAGRLHQDERQWLFNIFGNSGTAPVGYGGERCGTRVDDASVNFNNWICSKGWIGPDGLALGSYPGGRLTHSQRQWLFESFRNNGTAPVGYGGEFCPGNYTNSEQNFFAWVCSRNISGPDGIVPGSYDGSSITQQQREWLWDVFMEDPGGNSDVSIGFNGHHCPGQTGNYDDDYIRRARICNSGATGPYGMIPGNYNVDDLFENERAWLYDIFENTGDLPVGYGGENCPGQTSNYPPPDRSQPYNTATQACPVGVGAPGSFEPQSLTQQQRNELYWAFGHSGDAPIGYGGEYCYGGTMTLPSFNTEPENNSGGNNNIPTLYYGSSEPVGDRSIRVIAENGLNIREGQGTSHSIIGVAVYNAWFEVINGPTNGWYEITFDSRVGWVSEPYTEFRGNITQETENNGVQLPTFPTDATISGSKKGIFVDTDGAYHHYVEFAIFACTPSGYEWHVEGPLDPDIWHSTTGCIDTLWAFYSYPSNWDDGIPVNEWRIELETID